MHVAKEDARGIIRRPYLTTGWMMAVAMGLTLLAFALRLHHLGSDSFWVDEILTIQAARGGPAVILNQPHHPPLHYALTALSIAAFGESEFAARLPSMLASVPAIPLLIVLGQEMQQREAGLWSALLLAFSPLHLIYAQEARHYALLMTLSLASFVLLLRALRQPQWRWWLAFAMVTILNLYTHYAALIVLAVQGIITLLLLILDGRRPHRRLWLYGATSTFLVAAAFLPWLTRFLGTVNRNFDATIDTGTGSAQPLTMWLREAFYAFGMYHGYRPYLLLALTLASLGLWLYWRRWPALALAVGAVLLPVLLIDISNIARGSQVRYILFALPFYLLPAGAAIDAAVNLSWQLAPSVRGSTRASGAVLALAGLGLISISWPATRFEYGMMQTDWRGILSYLEENAAEDDVLLLLGTNYESGFNTVSAALPYYLEKGGYDYHTLPGYQVTMDDLQLLPAEANVWAVLYNWQNPTGFNASTVNAEPFRQWLHVLHSNGGGTTLQQITRLYEEITPLAAAPAPRCLLQRDLAAVRLAAGDTTGAQVNLAAAAEQCPAPGAPFAQLQAQTRFVLEEQMLAQAITAGDEQEAGRLARTVLRLNPHHAQALEVLTAVNLLTRFEDGSAIVQDSAAPEPVSVRRFTMPHNGDWGDVLFMHPPAAVSFTVELPAQPVTLDTRLALDPQSWEWGGDGVTFVVTVSPEEGPVEELMRRHIDASPEHRDWHNVSLSLEDYAGRQITLTLATETGPAGDGTGDWAGWDEPRLLWTP